MENQQSEALKIASQIELSTKCGFIGSAAQYENLFLAASSQLRQLHARNQELEAMLDAVGAGGVSAQRVTQAADHIAQDSNMVEAPVVLPEPVAVIENGSLKWKIPTGEYSIDVELIRCLHNLYTEQQVRELLATGSQPQADARGAAWSDLKIAFDIPDGEDETLWKCVESGAITLPNGWKLIETTGAGGVGPVAVFRTEHLPTSSETFVVGSAINYAIAASKENK